MNVSVSNGKAVIDGREFTGNRISINGNKVIVDGVVQDGELVGNISVVIHGDVEKIEVVSGTVKANSVTSIKTTSGDIDCGDVTGSVMTVSGDIDCGNVGGNVSTVSGDIIHRS